MSLFMPYFNPEFQRNLWLELSPHKFIATPLIIFAVLYLGYLTGGSDLATVVRWSVWLFALLTVVYGSFLAGDALVDEVQEHTWSLQRLTALSPWTMAWGKVFGGTIFAWYMGSWFLATLLLVSAMSTGVDNELIIHAKPVMSVLYLVGIAVCFQALAFVFALVQLQKSPEHIRRTILIPLLALAFAIVYVPYLLHRVPTEAVDVIWFYLHISEFNFSIMSIYINAGWLLCAAFMYMRRELQLVNPITVWLAFLGYQSLYFIGFTFNAAIDELPKIQVFDQQLNLPMMSFRVAIAFLLCHSFAYILAAIEKIDLMDLRLAWRSRRVSGIGQFINLLPRWLPTMLLTTLLGFVLLYFIRVEGYHEIPMTGMILALLGFMLRDVGLFVFFELSAKKRQVLTALIYMLMLYLVIPAILKILHLSFLLPWFYPRPDYAFAYAVGAPLLQGVVMWGLIAKRVREMMS